ncbi:MAG: ATP-binding domain-containing protein [Lachnospiraceae bacterium]|nr:ATP-binding domain-containing protein [Lachnospiraceae bacterium]
MKYCLDYDQYGEGQCARREKNYPGVVLTTAHSSKGMEWPIVFNDISHYHTKGLTREEVEEKRRLLFVSSTRARDELYLTGQSVAYGAKGKRVFNQFLMECHEILGEPFSFENPYEKTKSAGTRVS